MSRRSLNALTLAALLMGGVLAGFTHISVLYTDEALPEVTVTLLISISGAALTLGKCLCGQVSDRFCGRRASVLFLTLIVTGCGACCLGERCRCCRFSQWPYSEQVLR